MRRYLLPSLLLLAAGCSPARMIKAPTGDKSPLLAFAPTKAIPASRLDNNLYLTSGTPVRGVLTAGDSRLNDQTYADAYYYQAEAGESVTIDLTSTDFDAYVMVKQDPAAGPIAADDDSGEGLNARLSHTFTQAGTYIIEANSASPATGNYELRLTSGRAPAPRPQPPTTGPQTLAVGQRASGDLSQATLSLGDQPVQLFQFTAQAGQAYTIRTNTTAFDPMLYVVTQDNGGIQTYAADDDNGGGVNSMIVFEPTETRTYQLVVTSVNGRTGAYSVSMEAGGQPMPFTAFTDADWAQRYPGGGNAGAKYAVIVGIADNPPGLTDLGTVLGDVELMRRALVERLGFPAQNVLVITDREATRENIMQAIVRHLGQAGPQGTALFYYSGHGGQTDNSLVADDEPDGKDETLAVYSRRGGMTEILDDELGALAGRLRAGKIAFILDSCHSGTATRGEGENLAKQLTPEEQALVERPDSYLLGGTGDIGAGDIRSGNSINAAPMERVLVLSASASSETASAGGRWPDTTPASVFTHFLYKALMTTPATTTLDRMMESVRSQTIAYGRSLPQPSVQTPQIEGRDGSRTLAQFFGIR